MSTDLAELVLPAVLERARALAAQQGLLYAGGVPPLQAWQLLQDGEAQLVDVRSGEELKFVGGIL